MLPTTTTLSMSLPTLPADALPQMYVARLFERLGGQLGNKMADLYANAPPLVVQYEWSTALAGFNKHELKRGIAACQTRRFAPTVGEFAQLCRPTLDPDVAWAEAGEGLTARERGEHGEWSHPAVYRAAMVMYSEVRAGNLRACRSRWDVRLRQEFEKGFMEPVPNAPKRIANNPRLTTMSPEFRQKLQGLGFRVGRSS